MSAEGKLNADKIKTALVESVASGLIASAIVVRNASVRFFIHDSKGLGPSQNTQTPPGDPNKASAPGVLTGNLRQSIDYDDREVRSNKPNAKVGTPIFYGKIHEFGGQYGRSKFPARPFLRPALFNNREEVLSTMRKNFNLKFRELMK
jgi:HK97 gp10 family phage protein